MAQSMERYLENSGREFAMNSHERREPLPEGVERVWIEKASFPGPGGQHKNKSKNDRIAHAVLTDSRLIEYFKGPEATAQARGRSSRQNEERAREELREKIAAAWKVIEQAQANQKRKEELPYRKEPRGAKERRHEAKWHKSEKKRARQKPRFDE